MTGLDLDLSELSSSDLATKGRAFGQLTSAGVSIEEAGELVGLQVGS